MTERKDIRTTQESLLGGEIPRFKTGRVKWRQLAQDQELFQKYVLLEAKTIVEETGNFSSSFLQQSGRSDLSHAIVRYFPNGFIGVAHALDPDMPKVKPGYWQDTDNIRAEAKKVIESGIELTSNQLHAAGYSSLRKAIQENYVGGWTKLRNDLGLPSRYKPRGYWTPENIQKEAAAFIESGGELSYGNLQRAGKSGLGMAINNYPGGLTQLRYDLNIQNPTRPNGYFNDPANMEAEAQKIIEETGQLSSKDLKKRGLSNALKKYPGGVRALKEKLGISLDRVPHNHWSIERIVAETTSFIDQYGIFSFSALKQHGRGDLIRAISRNYPGAFKGLRKFLNTPDRIPTHEANSDLDSLFEGQNNA